MPEGFVPPSPPGVLPSSGKPGGADWRDRYRVGGLGREATCRQTATAYCGLLARVIAFIESEGQTAIVGIPQLQSEIFPAAVLTCDQLLPKNFEMGPEVTLLVDTGLVVGQGGYLALKKKRAREKSAKEKPVSAASSPPPPPPKPPEVKKEESRAEEIAKERSTEPTKLTMVKAESKWTELGFD